MKKRIIGLVMASIIVITVLAGCGTSSKSESKIQTSFSEGVQNDTSVKTTSDVFGSAENQSAVNGEAENPTSYEAAKDGDKAVGISGGSDFSREVSNAILAERKVIRSANISAEVEDFDKAYGQIETFILGIGFIQSTNINSEKYYVDNVQKLIRRGTVVIRVDKEKFDKVLGNLKGIGEILNWNINGEDVTDKFYDTESRLRLLKIEEGKLEEYLKKLNDLDLIFKTESRLTEIRYQIESLTGNLKKMSDLVELSTITLNINEKYPDSGEPPKPKTYAQKLIDNFVESMKGVLSFVGEFVIIVVAAIPVLVLIGVVVILGIFIYKRIPKKSSRSKYTNSVEVKDKDNQA